MMFRHFGGLSSPELSQPIVTTYAGFTPILPAAAMGLPLVFKDDIAHAETPPRSYPKDTGFRSTGMQLINDDTTSIFFSLDGIRDHFELKGGENILFDFIRAQGIWLRGENGGEDYRLIVW
jgi:hypothetical protein